MILKKNILFKMAFLIWITLFAILFGVTFSEGIQKPKNYIPQNGYVPDENTAIKIAEAVWLPIYGERIYDRKPFVASLVDNSIWVVQGTLKPGKLGGVPYAEIQKIDGKILRISHTK